MPSQPVAGKAYCNSKMCSAWADITKEQGNQTVQVKKACPESLTQSE